MDNWGTQIDSATTSDTLDAAIKEFEKVIDSEPTAEHLYYLGTAYSKLSDFTKREIGFHQTEVHNRTIAKYHLNNAYRNGLSDPLLATRALTNLTNLLYSGHRWIEALHGYIRAVSIEERNGVASSAIIKIAIDQMRLGLLKSDYTRFLVNSYLPTFYNSESFTNSISGNKWTDLFHELLERRADIIQHRWYDKKKVRLSPYEKFCFDNSLYLKSFVPREFYELTEGDSIEIVRFEQNGSSLSLEAINHLFSEIKECYFIARQNAFTYFKNTAKGNHYQLTTALKLAVDVLDKISVAVWQILCDTETSIEKVHFYSLWFKSSGEFGELKPAYQNEASKGNPGLLALIELAYDFGYFIGKKQDRKEYSYLSEKKQLRNFSTHDFVTICDLKIPCAKTITIKDLESEVLETLFTVKCAINYFVEFIYWRNTLIIKKTSAIGV